MPPWRSLAETETSGGGGGRRLFSHKVLRGIRCMLMFPWECQELMHSILNLLAKSVLLRHFLYSRCNPLFGLILDLFSTVYGIATDKVWWWCRGHRALGVCHPFRLSNYKAGLSGPDAKIGLVGRARIKLMPLFALILDLFSTVSGIATDKVCWWCRGHRALVVRRPFRLSNYEGGLSGPDAKIGPLGRA